MEAIDLVPLLLWAIAFSLLYLLAQMARAVQAPFAALPWPLDKIGSPIASAIGVVGDALQTAKDGAEGQMAKWFAGLADWVLLTIAAPVLLAEGIYKALDYLWNTALHPEIAAVVSPVRTIAQNALAKAEAAATAANGALTRAETYVDRQIAAAAVAMQAYADAAARTAKNAAEGYADTAVAKLEAAETAAINGAVRIADQAKNAAADALSTAEARIAAGVSQAERVAGDLVGQGVRAAEAEAAAALAASEAAGRTALDQVRSIAIGAETDLRDLVGANGAAEVGLLIASIPALATLVNAIASEAGLSRAECRQKVGQICGTDPSAWGALLAGAAALGVAFTLADVIRAALALIPDVGHLIDQVAAVSADDVNAIGNAIGEAALAVLG